MAYSYHIELFGKKKDSQERLASTRSALLDITLNYDDGSANLRCANCKRRVESLELDGDDGPHEVYEVSSCAAI